jgi:hypothetical protein
VKEISLSDLVKQPPKKPIFSFLIHLKKTGSFEGDEQIDSMNEDPREPPKCILGRAGRIIFEPQDTDSDHDEEDRILDCEKETYRRLQVSNQKRDRNRFAPEDDFGFESPEDDNEPAISAPATTTTDNKRQRSMTSSSSGRRGTDVQKTASSTTNGVT